MKAKSVAGHSIVGRRQLIHRSVVPLTCLAIFFTFATLYCVAPAAYERLLRAFILIPFRYPFIDWAGIPSSIECWRRGVDVYVENTCFEPQLHLPFPYSPLWLRATFIPFDPAWINPVGIFLAISFCIALGTLPATPGRADTRTMLLAAGSNVTLYAVERGNVDLIMFLMSVIAIHLWSGSLRHRLTAYVIFTAAGFLKFYPFILLTLALRERPKIFVPIATIFCLTLTVFVWHFYDELLEAKAAVPTGSYFTGLFGAVNLPYGLGSLSLRALGAFGVQGSETNVIVEKALPKILLLLLLTDASMRAIRLSERCGVRQELLRMPLREQGFLVAGALLVCGCFLTGQSVDYRGIFLLLPLPGVLRLSRTLPDAATRRVFAATALAMVFVMWVLTIQFLTVVFGLSPRPDRDTSVAGLVHWLLHEAAWWWIIGVLLSTILGFVLNSATWRAVWTALAGKSARLADGRRYQED